MARQQEEQQLIYRIGCDRHSGIGGAPLLLILQKESAKPILVVLLGTKSYTSRTPIIKDQRKKKGQGYILQDERKPPPASLSVRSAQKSHPSSFALPYLFSNGDPYQHQSMQYPTDQSQGPSTFGQPSYDLSYSNQAMSFGQQQQQQMFSGNPSFGGGGNQTYPTFQPPTLQNQPYTLSNKNSGMGLSYGRTGSTMETPPLPFYSRERRMMPMQQDNNVPFAPWSQMDQQAIPTMQSNPAHQIRTSGVPPPPPTFRMMMNGPKTSKSVSFAPLSDHIVV